MANNRLYLLHKDSGCAIRLAKSLVGGWYDATSSQQLEGFYQYLAEEHGEVNGSSSAFEIVCERIGYNKIESFYKGKYNIEYVDMMKGGDQDGKEERL